MREATASYDDWVVSARKLSGWRASLGNFEPASPIRQGANERWLDDQRFARTG